MLLYSNILCIFVFFTVDLYSPKEMVDAEMVYGGLVQGKRLFPALSKLFLNLLLGNLTVYMMGCFCICFRTKYVLLVNVRTFDVRYYNRF